MAYSKADTGSTGQANAQESLTFQADGAERINLPSTDFVADAAMTREGGDLILTTPSGEVAVIEGYFNADPAPLLQSPDGSVLTANLVEAFAKSPSEFAANNSASDKSPVGAVEEVKGEATVTRADGTVEKITIGTPIYEGDIVETDASGAVNIVFMDETSMAVSENARLAIDEYTFDPSTESGTTNFSVLRGLFVFTSGLIGRDDPDDVSIDTPVGSIGIRGTVIAGDINPGGESKITVLEGAIVVKNGLGDVTLSEQFETVRIGSFDQPMENIGTVPANDIGTRFNSIGTVNPSLFTTINDAAGEQSNTQQPSNQTQPTTEAAPEAQNQNQSSQADIVTLNDTAGLPSTQSTAQAPMDTSSGTAASASATPPASTSAISGTFTAPTVTTPDFRPNPFANGGLSIGLMGGTILDTAVSGTVVGMLHTPAGTSYTYTFANGSLTSGNGYFALSGNNVVLTSVGADELGNSLDVVQLGGFGIRATNSAGQTITQSFGITVNDAHGAGQTVDMNNPTVGNGVSVISDNLNNKIGHSITALGDVDNDGFDDFAFTNNPALAGSNHIYRIEGRADSLPSVSFTDAALTGESIVTMITGAVADPENIVAGIGDFNGDGINDYITGQQQNNTATITSGAVSNALGSNSITIAGTGISGWQIGADVDGIGDYNNDGYADVIVGAPGMTSGDGGAYFIKGGTSWTADISNAQTGGTGNWLRMIGSSTEAFGSSVSGLGDINGDGFSDFGIGAPADSTYNTNGGAVYLYHGQQGANPTSANHLIVGAAGQFLGQEVSGLGDINGDGLSDILVGGALNTGQIHFGKSSGATPYVTPEITINIPDGLYTLTGGGGVGDFNGDGYDDFAISVSKTDGTMGSNTYVVFGKDFGASTTIDLAYLKNPNNAMEFVYNAANKDDDIEINSIGDINGDGYDDFALGVPDANPAAAGNGGVAVVYGRDTGSTSPIDTATAARKALVGTSGDDTLDDAGLFDVSMRGGAGNDTFHVSNTNFLGIDGGGNTSGNSDRILMQGNLDFTNVNFEQISGIEAIQFGAANQTLTLTLENIFNLLKSSDTGYLKIATALTGSVLNIDADTVTGTGANTTPGDTNIVNALNDMGSSAAVEADAGGFRHFTIGGYDLYISDSANLTVNVV